MHESVDHGCCQDVVGEALTPATECHVRGDQQAALFIAVCHQLEKQVGRIGVKENIAQLIWGHVAIVF